MLHGMKLRVIFIEWILVVLQVLPFVEEYLAAPYASPQCVEAYPFHWALAQVEALHMG